ncbi:hypothetical protein AYO20_09246 [Fonsecaea nubica]|uniref:Uncharacterized protein n=1 Tax=Fonsecaea nubica TaxID=856822 RepID=A0A178CJH4_9EURO|nr:hypothetical protein AYO20_09246 [Fonsecaea nubica]OAL29193.1 hypothetical protein AYO20_09246 [Fonsecaea nubica]
MASPSRRVLGDKDPNAPIQHLSSKVPGRVSQLASPVAQRSSTKRPRSPEHFPSSSPRTGQKRKIGEVHSEGQALSEETVAASFLSQTTGLLSDTRSEDDDDDVQTSMAQSRSTLATAFTTFRGSQEESSLIESEFHIHDEPSQQALDKMHAVTLTQSTSQLVPPLRPSFAKEASQVSLSMSSLIDFDTNRSSQDDEMQMIEEVETLAQKPKAEEDARKQMMLEKAETLRTRLQLALYKIQTNQITKPFSRLQVPRITSPPPRLSKPSSSSPQSSSTVRQTPAPESSVDQEARVAVARACATMGPKPAVKQLSSLPMPEIVPTAFSARWNREVDPHQESQSSLIQPSQVPSSPPLSQTDHTPEPSVIEANLDAKQITPLQLSSPAPSPRGEDDDGRCNPLPVAGLASSVIQGEAANSLLDLVRGVRSGGIGMCGV